MDVSSWYQFYMQYLKIKLYNYKLKAFICSKLIKIMLKILQWRNTCRTVMLRTFVTFDVKKKKHQKRRKTQQPAKRQQPAKTPQHLFVHFSVTHRWRDFTLSRVFNFNISVRFFLRKAFISFPKYHLQILSLIALELTSLIQCDTVHKTVKISLWHFSFTLHSLPYSEGQAKTLHWVLMSQESEWGRAKYTHTLWWKRLSNTHSCQTDEQFLTELGFTMKAGPRTNQI